MKPSTLVAVTALAASAAITATLLLTRQQLDPTEPEPVAPAVRVMHVDPGSVQLVVHAQGTVAPRTEADLVPEVSGNVLWISPNLVAGGYFEEGEPLLRIDDRDYRNALERARATVNRAMAEDEFARFELQRLREMEARNLISASEEGLARQARQAFYGEEVQRVQRGAEDIRVMVRYPEAERRSLGDLEDMRIRAADGTEIPFAAVADIELGRGYSTITRVDRQRVVTVRADVDRDVVTPEAVLRSLETDALPRILSGYRGIGYSLTGEQEQRNESFGGLFNFIPVALLMIYALLAIPLRSYLQPLVIMSIIPFGAVGAVIGHVIMGSSIIIRSIFGLIALAGVVVNSSLVLVDYINRQRRMGVDVRVAVHRACIVRFRPILITSTTTFAGLMPLMLNNNPATAFFVPMAISLAWGVLFATGITLFLVPCLYMIVEDLVPTEPALARQYA